jgi:prevent-host-death family protein
LALIKENVQTLLHLSTLEVTDMSITTISSREFNQDVGRAKRATQQGPVFITDRGKPAQVLLSLEEYQRLTGKQHNLVEALSMPGLSEIAFDPPCAGIQSRDPDLS